MQTNASTTEDDDKEEKMRIIVRNSVNNQFVANKNFTNENGIWVDTEFSDSSKLSEVSIQFASDEYFRLVEANRELTPYLALGDRVVVVWKGKVYRITR